MNNLFETLAARGFVENGGGVSQEEYQQGEEQPEQEQEQAQEESAQSQSQEQVPEQQGHPGYNQRQQNAYGHGQHPHHYQQQQQQGGNRYGDRYGNKRRRSEDVDGGAGPHGQGYDRPGKQMRGPGGYGHRHQPYPPMGGGDRRFGGPGGPNMQPGWGMPPQMGGMRPPMGMPPMGMGMPPMGMMGMPPMGPGGPRYGHGPGPGPRGPHMPMRPGYPGGQPPRQPGQQGGPRPRCRDYDEQGFCLRGDMCPYDHGTDRLVAGAAGAFYPDQGATADSSAVVLTQEQQQQQQQQQRQHQQMQYEGGMNMGMEGQGGNFAGGRGRGRGGRGGMTMGRGRGRGGMMRNDGFARGEYRSDLTKLVVEKIPLENCTMDQVNDFFKKFGTIVNITLQPNFQKALVEFSSNAEALAAYKCPDTVFNNRFVKVYWHQASNAGEDNKPTGQGAPSSSSHRHVVISEEEQKQQQQQKIEEASARAAELAEKRRQLLAQQQERLKAVHDLQKQKEMLLQKQIEQQKQLMEMLENKSLDAETRASIMNSLKQLSEQIQPLLKSTTNQLAATASVSKSQLNMQAKKAIAEEKEKERLDKELEMLNKLTSLQAEEEELRKRTEEAGGEGAPAPEEVDAATKSLQEKLEALKAEAASMGIDVEALKAGGVGASGPAYRFSGGRGRGMRGGFHRGAPRGAPRGGRGGWRGRGGAVGGAYVNPYKLDLRLQRVTKVVVKGIEVDKIMDGYDMVRSLFEKFGAVKDFSVNEESGLVFVDYEDRKSAELAVSQGYKFDAFSGMKISITWFVEKNTNPATGNEEAGGGEGGEQGEGGEDNVEGQEFYGEEYAGEEEQPAEEF